MKKGGFYRYIDPMKLRLVGIAVPALVAASFDTRAQDQRSGESSAFARIAAVVEGAIAQHQLPGAVVLVGQGDREVYRQAFGQRAILPSPEPQFFATLDRPCSRTEDELTHLGEGVLAEEADAQRRYDEETANGRDGTGQSRWERQVNGMLKELASFAQFLAFATAA